MSNYINSIKQRLQEVGAAQELPPSDEAKVVPPQGEEMMVGANPISAAGAIAQNSAAVLRANLGKENANPDEMRHHVQVLESTISDQERIRDDYAELRRVVDSATNVAIENYAIVKVKKYLLRKMPNAFFISLFAGHLRTRASQQYFSVDIAKMVIAVLVEMTRAPVGGPEDRAVVFDHVGTAAIDHNLKLIFYTESLLPPDATPKQLEEQELQRLMYRNSPIGQMIDEDSDDPDGNGMFILEPGVLAARRFALSFINSILPRGLTVRHGGDNAMNSILKFHLHPPESREREVLDAFAGLSAAAFTNDNQTQQVAFVSHYHYNIVAGAFETAKTRMRMALSAYFDIQLPENSFQDAMARGDAGGRGPIRGGVFVTQ
jgi:hypothetical protein